MCFVCSVAGDRCLLTRCPADAAAQHAEGAAAVVEMETLLSTRREAAAGKTHSMLLMSANETGDVAMPLAHDEPDEHGHLHGDGGECTAATRKGHSPGLAALPEHSRSAVLMTLVVSFGVLLATLYMLPPLRQVQEGDKFLWRPRSADDFELDKRVLVRYREENVLQLLLGMASVFIILQTFCVPGSGTTLNVLAGCIFSETLPRGEYLVALPMAVVCVSFGAVLCYLVSYLSLRALVSRHFPARVQWLRAKVADLRPMSMVLFFVSLRVSPVVPAYLLNLAAPLTPLPLLHFWVATVLGCTPHAIVTVTAGATLSRLKPGEDVMGRNNLSQILFLLVLSIVVALIPAVIKRCGGSAMVAAQSSV